MDDVQECGWLTGIVNKSDEGTFTLSATIVCLKYIFGIKKLFVLVCCFRQQAVARYMAP